MRLLALIAACGLWAAACGSDFTSDPGTGLEGSDAGDGSAGKDSGSSQAESGTGGSDGTGGRIETGGSGGTDGSATGGDGAGGDGGAGGSGATGGSDGSGGDGTGGSGVVDASVPPPIPSTGLRLWLRADAGVVHGLNGRVSVWEDQSGNHMDASQSAPEFQPAFVASALNGLPVVSFDGVQDYLELPTGFRDFSQGLSIFAVAQSEGGDECRGIFETSNGPEQQDIHLGRHGAELQYEVSDSVIRAGTFPAAIPRRVSLLHDPSTVVQLGQGDGAFVATNLDLPEVIDRSFAYIGRSLYDACPTWNGFIGELLLYDRALDSDEYDAVDAYLVTRWGR